MCKPNPCFLSKILSQNPHFSSLLSSCSFSSSLSPPFPTWVLTLPQRFPEGDQDVFINVCLFVLFACLCLMIPPIWISQGREFSWAWNWSCCLIIDLQKPTSTHGGVAKGPKLQLALQGAYSMTATAIREYIWFTTVFLGADVLCPNNFSHIHCAHFYL